MNRHITLSLPSETWEAIMDHAYANGMGVEEAVVDLVGKASLPEPARITSD